MKNDVAELIEDVREQVLYLQELGVETLAADLPEVGTKLAATPKAVPRAETPKREPPPPLRSVAVPAQPAPSRSRLASLPSLKKRPAATPPAVAESSPTEAMNDTTTGAAPVIDSMFGDMSGLPESTETMQQIWDDLGNCTRCPLNEGRTQIVQTVGNYEADLMFVGEAPGADEDAKGEPFVGRAGQLLNKIIEAIGMKREDVCIGNINRCRPPGNRQPTLPEAHTCKPFLLREIAVVRPKVIVVLGNTALHNLLDTKVGITRMRGQFHDYYGVKVMPTFHPAYLLRDPSKKREVWEDMKKVKEYLVSVSG
jgi:uracil-DNA glycosylase family 4